MKTIGISTPRLSAKHRTLLAALGEVFGLRVEQRDFDRSDDVDAWIFPHADRDIIARVQHCPLPCYVVVADEHRTDCGPASVVDFADCAAAPPLLRGRHLRSDDAILLKALPQWLHCATTLAAKAKAPIWATDGTREKRKHYVAAPLPGLKAEEALFEHFNGDRFLALLPLVTFLREVSEDEQWEGPPLQACFMFDDPNLHWPTYGYIDYAQLAQHAALYGYHVAFGTIPLDGWFVHKAAAQLFTTHGEQLSLLVHGNDHIAEELAGRMGSEERVRVLTQALHRIRNMERRSGVKVSRVMAPPHGACSEETLAQMARIGYEAACISRGSLKHFNPRADWVPTVGMRAIDVIRGLPVVSRFRLSEHCQNAILVAALLRQPIIPVGHHQDVAKGPDLLRYLAQYINSLGQVRWADMSAIVRSQYARRMDGSVLRLQIHSNRIDAVVPDGASWLTIERQCGESDTRQMRLRIDDAPAVAIECGASPIPVSPGQRITIASIPMRESPAGLEFSGNPRPWPIIRRLLTETRDRLAPRMRISAQP